jgi:hypothetical protein
MAKLTSGSSCIRARLQSRRKHLKEIEDFNPCTAFLQDGWGGDEKVAETKKSPPKENFASEVLVDHKYTR